MTKQEIFAPSASNQRFRALNQMPDPNDFLWGFGGLIFGLRLLITGFFIAIAILSDTWYAPLLAILAGTYVGAFKPNFDNYRSFGLTTEVWKRHSFFAMALTAVIGVIFAIGLQLFVASSWWITAIYIASIGVTLAVHWRSNPDKERMQFAAAKQWKKPTTLADVAKTANAAPVRTLVTAPLLRAWLKMWAATVVAVIVVIGVGFLFAGDEPMGFVVPGMWTVMMISGSLVWVAIKNTFANHLALGGTRKEWINHYFITSLVNPLLMAILILPAWQLSDFITSGIVALMMSYAFWLPVFFCLLEFMETRSTWWIAIPFIAAATGLIIAVASGTVTSVQAVILSALAYAWAYFYLQVIRGRLNPYSGGISQYLGIDQP